MIIEASFSLALDYLYDPKSEVSNVIKSELQNYCKFLQNSKVCWFSAHKPTFPPCSMIQGPYHQPLDVNSLPGTGGAPNQLEQLNQSEPMQAFDSPEHFSGGPRAPNHPHGPCRVLWRGPSRLRLRFRPTRSPLITNTPDRTIRIQSACSLPGDGGPSRPVPSIPHHAPGSARGPAEGRYESSENHAPPGLHTNANVGGDKGMDIGDFLSGVNGSHPGSAASGPPRSHGGHHHTLAQRHRPDLLLRSCRPSRPPIMPSTAIIKSRPPITINPPISITIIINNQWISSLAIILALR
ncbi:hypothetical protein PCASD_18596 [Puccinia coronata f. sp. avenae]|uniref:Uncharacterized protein n=1 Tax=Puccinia coronata f. sp. avenae TaxID=200324 RepID=A0A2N5SZM2_9BASI|nr:hypothetical protein PCASD_18596 [Puccinia coronata f. sp. avenae]